MNSRARMLAVAGLALSALFTPPLHAGPQDQRTRYPVGITIGDNTFSGILDSGGTTTLSFEDAKKAGLLDENGDPKNPADGSVTLGGTGGGTVSCHKFNKVKIKVQAKNADGSNKGEPKEMEVTVFVPKKPSAQSGATDEEKEKKTKSVSTKAGANISGATVDGCKLVQNDKETADPTKNERSTEWVKTAVEDKKAPAKIDDNFEDEIIEETSLPNAGFNGLFTEAGLTSIPITIVPMSLMGALGVVPTGSMPLDFETHSALWISGYLNIPPDADRPMAMQTGLLPRIDIPCIGGDMHSVLDVAVVLNPDPASQELFVLGVNGLIPGDTSGWLDNETQTVRFAVDPHPCVADFNGDGRVNTLDFIAYLNAFNAGDASADMDGNGVLNTIDFVIFLNEFNTGC